MSDDGDPQAGPDATAPWRVVVGTDGSALSRAAVELAADEAWGRGLPLHVVTLAEIVHGTGLDLASVVRLREAARARAALVRTQAADVARSRRPGLEVTGTVVPASDDVGAEQGPRARAELVGAALLVVGPRGRGGVPAFAMGTASGVLAAVSTCPVLVGSAARASASDPWVVGRPVVACVDTRRALPVLAVAVQEAQARHRPLVVLHVADEHATVADRTEWLRTLVRATVPTTTTSELRVSHGDVVAGVLEAAPEASVVVVGSRGTLALAGLALGSVSHEVLRASPVPVLVARARQDRGTGPGRPVPAGPQTVPG